MTNKLNFYLPKTKEKIFLIFRQVFGGDVIALFSCLIALKLVFIGKKCTLAVYFDFKNTYDRVWRGKLRK